MPAGTSRVVIFEVFESGQTRLGEQAEDIAKYRKEYREFESDNKKRDQRNDGLSADHQIPLEWP